MTDELRDPQCWYLAQCDGEWEHTVGISIDTLDNPGWRIEAHVAGTALAERAFDQVKIERSEHDWLHAWAGVPERPNPVTRVQAKAFQAACGPENLPEALRMFLDWSQG